MITNGVQRAYQKQINMKAVKELKHLAIDSDKSLDNHIEEAILDLLEMYKKKDKE